MELRENLYEKRYREISGRLRSTLRSLRELREKYSSVEKIRNENRNWATKNKKENWLPKDVFKVERITLGIVNFSIR